MYRLPGPESSELTGQERRINGTFKGYDKLDSENDTFHRKDFHYRCEADDELVEGTLVIGRRGI